jgi:hypothetical protein
VGVAVAFLALAIVPFLIKGWDRIAEKRSAQSAA